MNLTMLQKKKAAQEKIAALTCYDASFAKLMEGAGVDILLVGDSLGMVLQGASSTLSVTLQEMEYHTRCVASGSHTACIIADLPFGSYQQNPEQALRSAVRLMAAGAHVVKLEGGTVMAATIRFLVERGIPVCGHLGLTPQSVHQLGGYRVQGRSSDEAAAMLNSAKVLADAGASLLVIEMVPAVLAASITASIGIPTIGIGAGIDCDGQVLVLQDMLGIYAGKSPKFSRNFMQGAASIQAAVERYVAAVRSREFPAPEHSF